MTPRGFMAENAARLRDCIRNPRSFGSDDDGGPLVEFTVLAPLFFVILFGIVEWGSMFYLQNSMVNAAREGARTAAVQGGTMANASNAACKWLGGSGQTFTITSTDKCTASQDVSVQVSLSRANASLLNMFFTMDSSGGLSISTWGGTLGASVTMRKENTCSGTQAANTCSCNTTSTTATGC
jgi:Flp pilus assembly protein TadG